MSKRPRPITVTQIAPPLNTIVVLAVQNCDMEPEPRRIGDDFQAFQQFVGGHFAVHPIAPRLAVYFNEDGLNLGLGYNRCGFVGDFFISKVSAAGNPISMTEKDIAAARKWIVRNANYPPICHVCGKHGGCTMFCRCRDVLIFCRSCYNGLAKVMNGKDKALKEKYVLCCSCQQMKGENECQ